MFLFFFPFLPESRPNVMTSTVVENSTQDAHRNSMHGLLLFFSFLARLFFFFFFFFFTMCKQMPNVGPGALDVLRIEKRSPLFLFLSMPTIFFFFFFPPPVIGQPLSSGMQERSRRTFYSPSFFFPCYQVLLFSGCALSGGRK